MRTKFGLFWLVVGILLVSTGVNAQEQNRWQPTLEGAKRLAGQTDRLVMIYFWADWCSVCRRMENEVLDQPAVAAALETNYVPVKINADHFPATARQFGVTALPTTILITAQGRTLEKLQGRMEASEYVARLNQIAGIAKPPSGERYAQVSPGPAGFATQPPNSAPRQPAAPSPPSYAAAAAPPSNHPAWQAPVASIAPRYNNLTSAAPAPTGQGVAGSSPGVSPPQIPPRTQPQTPSYRQNVTEPSGLIGRTGSMNSPPAVPEAVAPSALLPRPTAQPSAGNPPLGLDGYCPVTLADKKTSWTLGDRRWGAIHRGRTYLFAGPEQQRRFLADPDRYAPVMSGNDVVLALERGQTVAGRREHGVFFGDKIFLFATEETLKQFTENPKRYTDRIAQALQAQTPPGYQRR